MLLSISFEPDLLHTSILYYYHIIETLQYINIGGKQPAKNEAYFFEMMATIPIYLVSVFLFILQPTFSIIEHLPIF
jgi:hypothetical protein